MLIILHQIVWMKKLFQNYRTFFKVLHSIFLITKVIFYERLSYFEFEERYVIILTRKTAWYLSGNFILILYDMSPFIIRRNYSCGWREIWNKTKNRIVILDICIIISDDTYNEVENTKVIDLILYRCMFIGNCIAIYLIDKNKCSFATHQEIIGKYLTTHVAKHFCREVMIHNFQVFLFFLRIGSEKPYPVQLLITL